MPDHSLLEQAHRIAAEFLAPRATQADLADQPPGDQIRALAEAGLLGITTPTLHGGQDVPADVVRDCVAAVAGGCGVTAFCYFQHIVGCRHIAACANEMLKAEVLPAFARGARFCSLAFSHLRRPGPPALSVRANGDAYIFTGVAPWMTGWGLADDVLLAGTLPDGRSAWVVAPLTAAPELQASPPMRLCAMNASATVSLSCRDLRVGPERLVKVLTPQELAADTGGAILFFSALSLGVARAAIDVVRSRGTGSEGLTQAADALERELQAAHAEVNRCGPVLPAALHARAWCIDLGVRAAHAAVVVGSGAANTIEHAAQRLFREAMVYTVIAQTRDLQHAMLPRLTARGGLTPG